MFANHHHHTIKSVPEKVYHPKRKQNHWAGKVAQWVGAPAMQAKDICAWGLGPTKSLTPYGIPSTLTSRWEVGTEELAGSSCHTQCNSRSNKRDQGSTRWKARIDFWKLSFVWALVCAVAPMEPYTRKLVSPRGCARACVHVRTYTHTHYINKWNVKYTKGEETLTISSHPLLPLAAINLPLSLWTWFF